MKNLKFLFIFCFLLVSNVLLFSQKKVKFKDVKKELSANLYETGIPLAMNFIKQNPKHFRCHYLLAKSYEQRSYELIKKQNSLFENLPKDKWTDKDFEENIKVMKKIITYIDSAIYFYKKSSSLITDGFLTKNIGICDSGFGTCYKEFYDKNTLESAREYIQNIVSDLQEQNNKYIIKYKNVKLTFSNMQLQKTDQQTINLTPFSWEDIPDSLSGCSCSFSALDSNNGILYFDDQYSNCIISINNNLILLRSTDGGTTFTNGNYTVSIINRKVIGEGEESTIYNAELVVTDKDGNKIIKKVTGSCGC